MELNDYQKVHFRDELRDARAAALRDAEEFDCILFAIERLGSCLLKMMHLATTKAFSTLLQKTPHSRCYRPTCIVGTRPSTDCSNSLYTLATMRCTRELSHGTLRPMPFRYP